jgi:hypothetical protein
MRLAWEEGLLFLRLTEVILMHDEGIREDVSQKPT